MRLVTFEQSGQQKLGGLVGDTQILDLAAARKRRSGSPDHASKAGRQSGIGRGHFSANQRRKT
jgi:hypothetical protein